MAVTPAAKNPDAFASSNLTGGNSATGALMGVPQSAPIPSAGQPPAPQSMPSGPMGFNNYFNAMSPPTPEHDNDAVIAQMFNSPASQAYQQQTQQNQARIQQMTAPKAPDGPQVALANDGSGSVIIGGKNYNLDDNATEAWQALNTPQGQQSMTQAPPGYHLAPAASVAGYLQNLDRGAGHAAYETGRQFLGGALGGGFDVLGNAAKWAGADTVGQGLKNIGEGWDYALGTDKPVDILGHGAVGKGFMNAGRAAGLAIPIVGANIGLGATLGPEAAAAFDVAAVAPLFGASDAQQTKESLIQQGVSEQQANEAGWKQFFLSGATQAALSYVGGRAMSGGVYDFVAGLKQAVKTGELTADQAAAIVTNPAYWKRFATGQAANAGVQTAGMAGQAAGSAAISNAAGGEYQDPLAAAGQGAESGLFMSALMSPMGLVSQAHDSRGRAVLREALKDPTLPADMLKAGAVDDVAARAVVQDKAADAVREKMSTMPISGAKADAWRGDVSKRNAEIVGDAMTAQEQAQAKLAAADSARRQAEAEEAQAAAAESQHDARRADLEAAFAPRPVPEPTEGAPAAPARTPAASGFAAGDPIDYKGRSGKVVHAYDDGSMIVRLDGDSQDLPVHKQDAANVTARPGPSPTEPQPLAQKPLAGDRVQWKGQNVTVTKVHGKYATLDTPAGKKTVPLRELHAPLPEAKTAVATEASPSAEKPAEGLSLDKIPYTTMSVSGNQTVRSTGESHIIDMGGRKVVVVNVGGKKIPFYLSTGDGGKKLTKPGHWYPMLGVGEGGWIAKGSDANLASYYNNGLLKHIAEHLDRALGDIGAPNKDHPKVTIEGLHSEHINGLFGEAGKTKIGDHEDTPVSALQPRVDHLTKVAEEHGYKEPSEADKTDMGLQSKGTTDTGAQRAKISAKKPLDEAQKSTVKQLLGQLIGKLKPKTIWHEDNERLLEAARETVGDEVVDNIQDLHELTKEREKLTNKLSSGKFMEKIHKAGAADTVAELRKAIDSNAKALEKVFTKLEEHVGTNTIQELQQAMKGKDKAGQGHEATRFSIAYRDYRDGQLGSTHSVRIAGNKTMRERRELGDFMKSALADVYHDGFTMGNAKFKPGVESLLMKIRHHSSAPFARIVASSLWKLLKSGDYSKDFKEPTFKFYTDKGLFDPKTGTIDETQKAPSRVGMYDPATNTVHIGPEGHNAETVLHETLHAMMAGYLQHTKNALTGAFGDLHAHVLKQIADRPDLWEKYMPEESREAILKDLQHGEKGIHEFLSYGLTNANFQSMMRELPASKKMSILGVAKSAWDGFVNIARAIFGIHKEKTSALSQFLDVSGRMLHGDDSARMRPYTGEALEAKGGKLADYKQRLVEFWDHLTQFPGREDDVFRIPAMDASAGTPNRSFTMDEIFAHHTKGDDFWKITPATKESPFVGRLLGTETPDKQATFEKVWTVLGSGADLSARAHIFEDSKGRITVQTAGMDAGRGEGWRILQTALAYAFYNKKIFANEYDHFGMTDAAVHRYTEAMLSAALKFKSTDFMEPAGPQFDKGLRDWMYKPEGRKLTSTADERFLTNVANMAEMVSDITHEKYPDIRDISYEPGVGFTRNGKPLNEAQIAELSATERRAVLTRAVADMSAAEVDRMHAAIELEGGAIPGTSGVFYSHATTESGLPVHDGVVDQSEIGYQKYHSGRAAFLETPMRSMLPSLFGENPTAVKRASKWVQDSKDWIAKNSPNLAGFLSRINPEFNVSAEISRMVEMYKMDKNAPVTFANELGKWITSAKNEDVIRAMDYMDALHMDRDVPAALSSLPEHVKLLVRDSYDMLMSALERTESKEVKKVYGDLKPSEMLVHALQVDSLQSGSFGAREEKVLKGRKQPVNRIDVVAPTDETGIMQTGKFHPTYREGSREVMHMVHESMADSYKPEAGETAPDKNALFRFDKEGKKQDGKQPDWMFRELATPRSLLSKPGSDARHEVATSFQNLVSILSNGVAVRKLARDIAAIGTRPGDAASGVKRVVFADKGELLEHLNAERAAMGSKLKKRDVHVYDLSKTEARSHVVKNDIRKPGNWVKVPNTPAYGDLAGQIVHGPVWARIQDAVNRSPVVDNAIYNGVMRHFKAVKTKYSPGTMAANIAGNITMAHLNDIDFGTVKDAMGLYLRYKTKPESLSKAELQIMSEFHRSGATLGDWSTTEIKQMMYKAMVKQSEVGQAYEAGEVGILKHVKDWTGYNSEISQKAVDIAKRTGRKVDDVMSDIYATGDNMFRLAAFMDKMGELQRTMPDVPHADRLREAGLHAKKAFLDYDNDSRLVQTMKQTMLPFVSWSYAYGGMLAKTALHQPWKIASLALAYSMLSGALSAVFGEDDEVDKERKATGNDDRTWFGAHKQIYMGKDAQGRSRFFDAARWFMPSPMEFKDNPNGFMGIHSFPSALTPNNPFLTLVMNAAGLDPYTGKRFTKDTASNLENLVAVSKRMYNVMAPPAATFDGKGNLKVLGAEPGLMGKVEPGSVYYARMFMGIPLKSVDPDEARQGVALHITATERAFQAELRNQARMEAMHQISPEEAEKTRAKLLQRMQEQIAELQKGL